MVKRFEVYMYETHNQQKPCLVISPDELNMHLPYVLVAPITTSDHELPSRIGVGLKGKKAQIALDLIQPISQTALKARVGLLPEKTHEGIIDLLQKFFSI